MQKVENLMYFLALHNSRALKSAAQYAASEFEYRSRAYLALLRLFFASIYNPQFYASRTAIIPSASVI